MAVAKKKAKKKMMYRGKPLYRVGDRLYYGNLTDKYILVLDVLETEQQKETKVSKRIAVQIMDNRCELGKGQIFRKAERPNLYKALDIGEWWLKEAVTEY